MGDSRLISDELCALENFEEMMKPRYDKVNEASCN